ncbi:M56 family metallopeptidase [Sphingomonas sp. Mn802worker]|uniref:M56 family metallopeptidase n=1 Tax=Sphingomonas sp. Mn802worker TaxID=629773 RepID=UPI00035EDBD4|nr:M56 family metallopeptidase [Sphingomonas sp. Mn802worker]
MIALAVEALVASSALMLLVLVLRAPVRRAFGAQVAYLLWLLPLLRLVLPPLPDDWHATVTTPMTGMGERALVLMANTAPADAPALVAPVTQPAGAAGWLALLWLSGAVAILAVQLTQYLRFRARVLRTAVPLTHIGSVEVVESAAATGPLAFGLWRRVVAFPRDFAERYDAQERELALAHEVGHHHRGDLWANWVALGLLALHWFNPVAWIAFRAFRADQEMANDAGVLAGAGPEFRHAYGCAIVKAAHGRALTPACHLNTINDLKGRLRMLARGRVSRRRLAAGGGAVALLAGTGLALTASGMPAAARVRDGVEHVTGLRLDTLDRTFAEAMRPLAHARTTSRVTIVENGHATVLTGDEAAAYVAQNPVPIAPVPPVPPPPPSTGYNAQAPVPPATPVPPAVPVAVSSGRGGCVDGATSVVRSSNGRRVLICETGSDGDVTGVSSEAMADAREAQRDANSARQEALRESMEARREAMREAREAQREAMRVRQEALRESNSALRSALGSLATTRASLAADRDLSGSERADALREVDKALAQVKAQMAGID